MVELSSLLEHPPSLVGIRALFFCFFELLTRLFLVKAIQIVLGEEHIFILLEGKDRSGLLINIRLVFGSTILQVFLH